MALKITNVVRPNPSCGHVRVTVTLDTPVERTYVFREVTKDDIDSIFDRDAPWWAVLGILWLKGRLEAGFTVAQSTNVEIVG
jgi:hypothetical protein